ncbi:hypothetical protein [Halococcus sp. IIIV-5B]|uniref:hypothetical protein n=1 Tax=Halococcus sp. IIIV-5B TaxID=2321230 RepID=UPI001314B062|nr:hypothetical protein [Halococcus sp. IIIV-5B]
MNPDSGSDTELFEFFLRSLGTEFINGVFLEQFLAFSFSQFVDRPKAMTHCNSQDEGMGQKPC